MESFQDIKLPSTESVKVIGISAMLESDGKFYYPFLGESKLALFQYYLTRGRKATHKHSCFVDKNSIELPKFKGEMVHLAELFCEGYQLGPVSGTSSSKTHIIIWLRSSNSDEIRPYRLLCWFCSSMSHKEFDIYINSKLGSILNKWMQ